LAQTRVHRDRPIAADAAEHFGRPVERTVGMGARIVV
jgi:hypothetical protein